MDIKQVLKASLAYFLAVFGAGFLLGTVRVTWLVPHLGTRTAELLELPLMAVVVWLAARWVVQRFPVVHPFGRWLVGLFALDFVIATEILLGYALSGRTAVQFFTDRDPVSGTLYFLLLAVMAVLPGWLARFRAA
jgi:hypothetical protein